MTEERWSSPLLSVKQAVPPLRGGVLPRARLEARLATTTATKLTTVIAPAGWGKTSLVSGWAHNTTDASVAWVSLDSTDDEPFRFWSYALSSLRSAGGQITPASIDALRASTDAPTFQALPIMLNELAESAIPHVLVLDDFHVISHREVHESLEFLLAYLPPSLRIVILSRWDPPLPLARMRVRGELTELRADDLRFSPEESATFVSMVSASEVQPTVSRAIWERTEGWAAGLQLAGLAMRDSAGVHIGGAGRHLFDYFSTEVFPALAPAQRDLLVHAAPLEYLSGSLCDAALDIQGSAAVLRELEQADLFVAALDPEREWYRCHPLLREALLRTDRRSAGADRDVLRRAARWFEEHDRIDDAIGHLLSAGDTAAAEQRLRDAEVWFLQRRWAGTYLSLGERLPEEVVHPSLALSMTYAAEFSSQRDRAIRWLDLCDRRIDETTIVERWRSPHAAVMALRAVMGVPASETALSVSNCEQAVELEAASGSPNDAVAQIALGRAYGLDGRFEDGVRVLSAVWRQRVAVDWWVDLDLQVSGLLAFFLLQLDRVDEADRILLEVRRLPRAAERGDVGAQSAMGLPLLVVQGRRSHQRGDLAAGRQHLSDALRLAENFARPIFASLSLAFLVDVELDANNPSAARTAAAQAREIADNDPLPAFALRLIDAAESKVGRLSVRAARDAGALIEGLTDRELSILRMLPGTATQREIGSALFLSINTVKAYNKSLYRKLGASSRHDAVQNARRLGLI